MKKQSPLVDDNHRTPFRHIEFTLPTALRIKINAAARARVESKLDTITDWDTREALFASSQQPRPLKHYKEKRHQSLKEELQSSAAAGDRKRVEDKLRTIISSYLLITSIQLKVPPNKATQIIKKHHKFILKQLEKAASRINAIKSWPSFFLMIGYASTPEDGDAWLRFPDDLDRVIKIYRQSLVEGIFPTKGWPNTKAAMDVAEVLKAENIKPALTRGRIWSNVTKYVIEKATGECVDPEDVFNAMRQAHKLIAAHQGTECKNKEK